ncbi:hypothetical protein [Nocardia xishanensis]|uniref:hypothetical protein n=1 Tax=Nocardia xishanensis TaxID=238964 RepID=UPI000B325945|nr:hypothetical protein [Nocardia xishanensis]
MTATPRRFALADVIARRRSAWLLDAAGLTLDVRGLVPAEAIAAQSESIADPVRAWRLLAERRAEP